MAAKKKPRWQVQCKHKSHKPRYAGPWKDDLAKAKKARADHKRRNAGHDPVVVEDPT